MQTKSHVRAQIAWLTLLDLLCLVAGAVAGILMRLGHEEISSYVFGHLDGWLLFFGAVILGNYLAGSYRVQYTYSRFNLLVTWLFSLTFALFILSVTAYAWFAQVLGRGVFFLAIVWYSALSLTLKMLVYRALFRSERFTCRVAVVGIGRRAAMCARMIEREYVLPAHKVVAFVHVFDDEAPDGMPRFKDGIPVVDGRGGDLEDVIASLGVSLVVPAIDDLRLSTALYPPLKRLRFGGIEVLSPLSVAEIYSGTTPLDLITEDSLMRASMESAWPLAWRVKRVFDILTSILALAALAPLLALVALLTKLFEPRGPVLYSQTRMGRFGEPFRIYKVRTMRVDAEAESGPVWAAEDDPRITPLGSVLRRFRIDEIPQFINVLKGEMSLVGPRPERPELAAALARRIPFYEERKNMVPGLTGWAQIRYPYGSSTEDAARKLEYDIYYLKHMSLSLDLQIILSTLRIVLLGKERTN